MEIVEETFLDEFMDEWTLMGYTSVRKYRFFFFYRYVSTNHNNEHHQPNVDFNHCSSTSIRATYNRLLIIATLENEHPTRRVQQRYRGGSRQRKCG